MKKLILAIALIATPAAAQQPTSYTLTVTPTDLQTIGSALGSRPFNDVSELIQRLNAQISEQNKPKTEAPKDSAK